MYTYIFRYVPDHEWTPDIIERNTQMRGVDAGNDSDVQKALDRFVTNLSDLYYVEKVTLKDGSETKKTVWTSPGRQAELDAEAAARREVEKRDFAYWDREYATNALLKHVEDQIGTARHFIADLEREVKRFEHWDAQLHDAEPVYDTRRFATDVGNELAEALVTFIENIAHNSNARYSIKDAQGYSGAVVRWHERMEFYTEPLPDDGLGGSFDHALVLVTDPRLYGWDLTLPDDGQGTDEHLPRYMGPDYPHIPSHWYGWRETKHFRPPLDY